MNILIQNCNNINRAEIDIQEGKLNIKYASNGTGKSTISKAIELSTKSQSALLELIPFKYLEESSTSTKPSLEGAENINSVAVFNDRYIDQFVFKQDEIMNNSFDIFIKNQAFKKREEKINKIISKIKKVFANNSKLGEMITDLNTLSNCFG
ncbi:MAG: hypothetical protein WBB82_15200, partial [Limnothrix sp.]